MGTIRPYFSHRSSRPQFGAMPYQPAMPPMALSPDPSMLVAQLGMQTQIMLNGQVQYNEPLVQSIASYREQALPALRSLFQSTNNTPTILEALQAASRMADAQVRGVEQLYPALARWNSNPDPTIQMQLARFYRKINEPKTFGPMLATAVNYAILQYPSISLPVYNVSEEVGETLLNQIANRTAQETVRQLAPYLQFRLPINPRPFNQ